MRVVALGGGHGLAVTLTALRLLLVEPTAVVAVAALAVATGAWLAGPAGPPDLRWYRWSPGEELRLRFRVAVGPPDPHAYAPFLRGEAARRVSVNPLNPWMEPAQAASLAAEGLYRWHYHADEGVLYETAAFDREAAARPES